MAFLQLPLQPGLEELLLCGKQRLELVACVFVMRTCFTKWLAERLNGVEDIGIRRRHPKGKLKLDAAQRRTSVILQ